MPAFSALHPVLHRVKSVMSFLLAAPLMVVALSAASMSLTSGDASAQERQQRQGAGEFLTAAGRFHARLRALEKKAVMFKPDGVPVRAKVTTSTRETKTSTSSKGKKSGSGSLQGSLGVKPGPGQTQTQSKEHVLLARQISAHKAAIRKLQARVKAFEKEARGHEMGHNLDMPPAMAAKKKSSRSSPGERVNQPSYGAGLAAKSKALDRDIRALETEARAIYKKPGRLK